MLQLTGKENYARFGPLIGIDLVAEPDEAADPSVSLVIAMRFWEIGRVNDVVDKGDFTKARKITNGGRIGLEEVAVRRARRWHGGWRSGAIALTRRQLLRSTVDCMITVTT